MNPTIALNLDLLRKTAADYGSKPYWFGLGFIQLKLSDVSRVHYWTPWLKAEEREEIHDHRYDFTSTVIAGTLHFELYEAIRQPIPRHISRFDFDSAYTYNNILEARYNAAPDHELFETDCAPGHEGNNDPKVYPVVLQHRGTYDLPKGSKYWFSQDQFHTTEGTSFAITYLEREEKTKQFANVIKLKGAPVTCPFAKTKPEEECWAVIERAIANTWNDR